MCLAKIYTSNSNFNTPPLIDVANISEFKESEDYPILIIGKKNAENIFGKDRIKVLNKSITDNISWTYAKMEKRDEYETDLENFYHTLYTKIVKSAKYVSINIYQCKFEFLKRMINFINNKDEKYAYTTDRHVYIYCKGTTIGISLDEIEYCGVKKEKILSLIKNGSNVYHIKNDYSVTNALKKYVNDNKIVIPYLYYLKNQ